MDVGLCYNSASRNRVAPKMMIKDKLRFVFSGYTIWLEPEQFQGDLDLAIQTAAAELGVIPIPAPHATAIYGMSHLKEWEMRDRFCKLCAELKEWPDLEVSGFLSGVEFDGVNGGTMDMSWIEATCKTSLEHELLLDAMHDSFHIETAKPRTGPWHPHLSLAYSNPESPITPEYLASLVERYPTLSSNRRVKAISLWETGGTIEDWKCLERFNLDEESDTESESAEW